jgi:tol-pal system protein YbgF
VSAVASRSVTWLVAGVLGSGCVTVPQFYAHEAEFERAIKELKASSGAGGQTRLAELGTEVDALHEEIARLRGAVEETRYLAEQALSEARAARNATGSPAQPTEGSAAAPSGEPTGVSAEVRSYEEGFAFYRAGEYEAAIDRFRAFLENHASSDYADNALFWMGECYAKLGDYERAVLTFEDVVNRFPEGNKVPDALYRQGIALLEIGEQTRDEETYNAAAREIFKRIVREHPQSERVAEAQRQLEALGP